MKTLYYTALLTLSVCELGAGAPLDQPPPILPKEPQADQQIDPSVARAQEIRRLHLIADDPASTPEMKSAALKIALTLLDQDAKANAGAPQLNPISKESPPTEVHEADEIPKTTVSGKPIQDGLNIVSINAKVVKTSSNYNYVSWKVVLFNGGDIDLHDIFLRISFRDKDNFELDSSNGSVDILKPREPFTVTGIEMMSPEEWARVDGYTVRTR